MRLRFLCRLYTSLALAYGCAAQVQNPQVVYVSTDPTGLCAAAYVTVNIPTGNVQGCVGSPRAWASIGGSGGSMVYPGAGVANSTGSAWAASYTVGTSANNLVQLDGSARLPAVSAALLTNFPTFNQSTTGNAATATAAAGTPTLCPAGQAPAGILANFNATGCTAIGGGGSALSAITAASGTNTIASGDNSQTWQWAITTADKKAFSFTESAASTATGTPILFNINTLSSSTAIPFQATSNGIGWRVATDGSLASVGSTAAGAIQLTQGTAPTAGTTAVTIHAPSAVTSYTMVLPAASATGFLLGTNVSNVNTLSYVGSSGTGSVCLTVSCSMTTPALGAATATTINKVTITAPATAATLTIPDGVTMTGPAVSGTVATLGNTNTFTGRQDAGGAASTAPAKVGTSLPGTCTVGDLYFKSDATAGQNIYECQSTNTWTQQLNSGSGGGSTGTSVTSTTPVTVNANTTSEQFLMELSLGAGYLNNAGQPFNIYGAFIYSTPAAQTPTITINTRLCTVSGCGSGTNRLLASIVSTATVASVTNNSINFNLTAINHATGATGTLEVHGPLSIDLGALTTTADSIFNDVNTAVSGTIDLTAALFVDFTVTFSTNAAGANSMTQRSGGVMPFAATAPLVNSVAGTTGTTLPDFTYSSNTLTAAAAGKINMAAATSNQALVMPVIGGVTTFVPGSIAYDPNADIIHVAQGGSDAKVPQFSITPLNGECVNWVVSGGNQKLGSTGAPCGAGLTNAQTATYQALAADFSGNKTITVASGTFTVTLVASGSQPPAGQFIRVVNYGSGVVTIARSGQNINGGTTSLTLPAGSATAPTMAFVVSDATNYFAYLSQVPNATGCTNQFVRTLNGTAAPTCASIANADIANSTIDLTTKVTGVLPDVNIAAGVARTIAVGTSALGTSAIASGACATAVTTTATGTATTDVISAGFNGDPTGVTGYTPATTGMLAIIAYPSANNVNFKVCNTTLASITPGAITLNWRVAR